MTPDSQIGRELKVSELKPDTIVVVWKQGSRAAGTMWVRFIGLATVALYAGTIGATLLLARCGPDHEQVEDDDRVPMKLYEYLGPV